MSWMWIFILDGGLCLKICLFMELLQLGYCRAPKICQGRDVGQVAAGCDSVALGGGKVSLLLALLCALR